MTKSKRFDKIDKLFERAASRNTEKLLKKTSKKFLTKAKRYDIITKLFARATVKKQDLEN